MDSKGIVLLTASLLLAAGAGWAAYQYLEPRGWEIYGRPSDTALGSMREAATGAGVPLTVLPAHLGGFLRLRSA